MKIILVSPYVSIHSFGVRTLSSCLKKDGHEVRIIFLPRDFWIKYEETVLDEVVEISKTADLIGISLTTNLFDNVVRITQKLKRHLRIPILWGGVHPTIRPYECLDYADMICIGEGEKAIVELVKKIEDGQSYQNVQNIWLKHKEKIYINKLRPLIQDLNTIPFPDYDYWHHYLLVDTNIQKMSEDLLMKYTQRTYMTMPTRGCPFGCSYCCNNILNKMHSDQKPLRKRNIDNIIKELAQIKNKLPSIERIYFDDDAFFLYTTEEIRSFSMAYKENIKLPLIVTGATPSTLTREKLFPLVDAGLTFIRMGIQTGSERTKKLYKRHYSNHQVVRAAKVLNEFRDRIGPPQYDMIIDNPWETNDDLIETLMFLTQLPAPYSLFPFSLTLYPGTELYEKAKREGIISNELEQVYRKGFHNCGQSYLNKLFFLLQESQGKISTKTMSLLTNKTLRKLKLNWLLYIIMTWHIRVRGNPPQIFGKYFLSLIKRSHWLTSKIKCWIGLNN